MLKTLYCIKFSESDIQCGNRDSDMLHSTNKKRLDDLCNELNKKVKHIEGYSFSVKEIKPVDDITKEHINQFKKELDYYGLQL